MQPQNQEQQDTQQNTQTGSNMQRPAIQEILLPEIWYRKDEAGKKSAKNIIRAFVKARVLLDRFSKPERYSSMLGKFDIDYSSNVNIMPDMEILKTQRKLDGMMGLNCFEFHEGDGFTRFNYTINSIEKEEEKDQNNRQNYVKFVHLIRPSEENLINNIIEMLTLEKVLMSSVLGFKLKKASADCKLDAPVFNSHSYNGLLALTKLMARVAGNNKEGDIFEMNPDERTVKWMNFYYRLWQDIGYDNVIFLSATDLPDPDQDEYSYLAKHLLSLPFEID